MLLLRLHTFDVFAGSRIDANDVAHVDKDRSLKLSSGFCFDWLANIGRRIALGSWLTVFNFQFNKVRRRHQNRIAIEKCHLTNHLVFQILPVVTNLVCRHFKLLERFVVHEDVRVAAFVEILHVRFVNLRFLKRIVPLERSIQRCATEQILEFANVHCIPFSRLFEFHTGHDVGLAIDLNFEPFSEITCFVSHDWSRSGVLGESGITCERVNDSYDDRIEVKILANPEQSVTSTSSWQQHMKSAVRSVDTLLSMVELERCAELPPEAKDFPVFVPLPFLQRIEKGNISDPLLRQVLPVAAEGQSPDHYSVDPLQEQSATLADGLIQKYRKRVLVIASAACAINCRYCFRRHFPYETAAIGDRRWIATADAIKADETINEVILSGGDPLSVADEKLANIFETVANIGHIKRLRIHTRLPIVIPQRVTDSLLESIWKFRKSKQGRQVIVVVHSNHENELDQTVCDSLRLIDESATQVLNQSVLLAGVNDNVQALVRLSERLLESNVLPYYLHQLDPIRGTAHFEVPIAKGIELVSAMRAQLPGYAIPRYVQELAGESSKTILA